MNSILKQKWREQLENNVGHENLGGSGPSVPSLGSEPAPPGNFPAAVSPARSGTKRSKTIESAPAPPHKKRKTVSVPSGLDTNLGDLSVPEPDASLYCPTEMVTLYDRVYQVTETELIRRLRVLDESETIFQRHFSEACEVGAEVGMCAADLVWRRALKRIDISLPSYSEEDNDDEDDDGSPENISRTQAKMRDTIKNWAFTMPNLDPNSRGFNVTPKFLRLVQILKSCEPYGEEFRGIIFVQRRAVAFAISDLIPMLGEHVGFIRAHPITGQGSLLVDDKEQQEIFRRFELGLHNLLVATKSIEDLDLPKATIVIRFDLFEGDVSYAFARSRTKGKGSHLVHMLERNSDVHRRILLSSSTMDSDMIRWTNVLSCSLSSAVPPRPIIAPHYSEDSDAEDAEEDSTTIKEPIAGGRIRPQDATAIVYRLASINNQNTFQFPLFRYRIQNPGTAIPVYTCTVALPGTPADNITGQPCSSMAQARRAACYQVCVDLAKLGLLDPQFFLLLRSPVMAARQFERTEKSQVANGAYVGVQIYPRKKPDFWSNPAGPVTTLYPTVIVVEHTDQPPHAPMLLLTRHPLAKLPSFKLFFSGSPSVIQTYRGTPFTVDDEKTLALHMYTLRVCRAVVNKPFICPLADMQYFLAPLPPSWTLPESTGRWNLVDVVDHIPWNLVTRGADSWAMPLKYGRPEEVAKDIKDTVIQDRSTELTRRYDVLRVRPDLSPLSHPQDSPRETKFGSLLDYCKAVRKDFDGLKDEAQAIVEISTVMTGTARLDPASRPVPLSGQPPPRYLIPELCFKFTIPASTFRTALLFPSISRRIDSFLLVKELNAKFFDHQISEVLLDMAISAPSNRIEYDYERLELLGDSFLKFLSSIYVFVNEPSNNEGALHHARQHIISNQTLFHSSDSAGLPAYVQAKHFGPKSWQPPNFRISEDPPTKAESSKLRRESEQRLGDKVVADVAEAILGAAYLSGGSDVSLKAAKAMNLPFPNVEQWSDFGRKLLIPPPTITAKLKPGALEAVETIVKHKFKHPHLLAQALTHSSVSAFERVSYERLEFIGDAILDFLVIQHIFDRNPKLTPGGLTMLKGAMVSNTALAAVCVSSCLHNHLLLAPRLAESVEEYMAKLKVKQTQEYELALAEKRAPGQYWHDLETPKVLSDVVESVIGAIYISDNFASVGVEAFFKAVLKPFYDRHITLKTLAHHPTTILFELIQTHKCQKFQILKEKEVSETLCHVLVHDVILASGRGSSAQSAARDASLFALDALEGDSEFLMRNCDCPKHQDGRGRGGKALDDILSGLEEGGVN